MDWSKAKNILIIALFITCLILGGILGWQKYQEAAADKDAALSAEEYLESQGVSFNTDIPLKRPSLPVLFVGFHAAYSSQAPEYEEVSRYKGIEVEQENLMPYYATLISVGKEKAKVCTASSAVLWAAAEAEGLKGLEINNIDLVYYVGAQDINENSRDTAIPSWKVETNRGVFYINAFAQ